MPAGLIKNPEELRDLLAYPMHSLCRNSQGGVDCDRSDLADDTFVKSRRAPPLWRPIFPSELPYLLADRAPRQSGGLLKTCASRPDRCSRGAQRVIVATGEPELTSGSTQMGNIRPFDRTPRRRVFLSPFPRRSVPTGVNQAMSEIQENFGQTA